MITPSPPLQTLIFGLDDDTCTLEGLIEQAWQALDAATVYDRISFDIGYRTGLLAALGSLRERLVYGQ